MGLELSTSLSRTEVRRAFANTHNLYLTLNNQIAKAGPCFKPQIPAWRRQRDSWARFYSQGWSPRRYDDMQLYRMAALWFRSQLLDRCGLAERGLPLLVMR